MATVYNVMLYGGLILAIIFAIIAIVLFVVLKVPKAIGIVTGSTERKSVEEIREKGYESVQGMGASKKDAIKNHTSKISVRDVESSAAVKKEKKGRANYEKAIADLQNAKKGDMRELTDEEATNVLRYDEDGEEATDVLRTDDEEATDVLRVGDDEEATDVLKVDAQGEEKVRGAHSGAVKMIMDVVVVHSEEKI